MGLGLKGLVISGLTIYVTICGEGIARDGLAAVSG